MNFEEMKVIWSSQDGEPLYAIDETELRASVRRRSHAFMRRMFWRDVREIGIGLVSATAFLVFGVTLAAGTEDRWRDLLGPGVEVSRRDALAMLAVSALWLFFAGYQLVGRKRQERRERLFEPSLRGDLDRTISQTDYRIRMGRTVVWWGLLPVWLATVLFLHVLMRIVATPPAVLILAAIVIPAGFAIDLIWKRRPIRTELLPLKREFEALRNKLTASERRRDA
jgi:hypothetical protein